METIDEQSKCEEMSLHSPTSSVPLRICLVGPVVDDQSTVEAAHTFGVPVITSETGIEVLPDSKWITFFVVHDFEGPIFEAIQEYIEKNKDEKKAKKSQSSIDFCEESGRSKEHRRNDKHRIIGPPALQYAAHMKEDIATIIRPIYNYSMKGVVTCFTGIRKRDVLLKLVFLIHSMGGSIRSSVKTTAATHLITNARRGETYEIAMTFNLPVVPPSWVYAAWENRHVSDFRPTVEEFARQHKLKPFEGQKISFFGFAPDEHQHMVDVLVNNGGVEVELDDPECTHVVMANSGGYFPAAISSSSPHNSPSPNHTHNIDENQNNSDESENQNQDEAPHTPKSSKIKLKPKTDGVVVTCNEETEFSIPANISPILTTPKVERLPPVSPIDEERDEVDDETDLFPDDVDLKRKRESFDSISIISTDSFAVQTLNSAKKPKLTRTGSITRSLKRSMSFVAVRTPIANMLRPRRNSVDPNSSMNNSITSFDSTFNESIKKPVKEKLRGIRDRITRSSASKRDNATITPKTASLVASNTRTLKSICKFKMNRQSTPSITTATPTTSDFANPDSIDNGFKTPVAPKSLATNTFNHSPEPPVQQAYVTTTSATTTATADAKNVVTCHSSMNACDVSMSHFDGANLITVVDEHVTQSKPELKNNKTHIVKSDWFWYTIQNGYAFEKCYSFETYLDSIANTPQTDRRDSLPISLNKRKRKRFSQRIQAEGTPIGAGKRRSSVSDAGLLSVSGSFLDCTASPDKHQESLQLIVESESEINQTPKKRSKRYNLFMEFFSTESNYVGILDTIVNLFKNPLEEKADNDEEALLNRTEIKMIFGNFLLIHEVHREMLERLREIKNNWQEESAIGEIILHYRDQLIKAYPPYVNFYEQMKERLVHCDTQNPRFHAFLKINQAKPECGRQTLQELMIRPVQRLPSISLLLDGIKKHTNPNHPDYKKLDEALTAIIGIISYINEGKRITEERNAIFDIHKTIDGCPADLIAAHRSFISKCEVTELSGNLSGRDHTLILYLFSDKLEVCKKRSGVFNSAKSPSTAKSTDTNEGKKRFKHVSLMQLSSIRLVIDITDCPRAFALNCRNSQDNKDKLYSFLMSEDEVDKAVYLKSLCKQMAENACRTDTDKSLLFMTSQELDLDIPDSGLSTLARAFKYAARTRQKVGRAFSFNKTPSRLKRAVSTMMTSPFGSTNSLTPASQLAQMKLASCTNLNEVSEDCGRRDSSTSQTEKLIAPLSVQPTRKNKSASMSIGALRRL